MRPNYEVDETAFPADAYRMDGRGGIAWYVYGWETEPDEETVWSGIEVRTGNIIVCMVGDDRFESVDPDYMIPIADEDYCSVCGQIGCQHDGRERV